jgi:hypothetical protein
MDIQSFIADRIAASNAFDTKKYLSFYLPFCVLDNRLQYPYKTGRFKDKE